MLHKNTVIKSKKIRASAKGEDCLLRMPGCRNDTSTVSLCHLNSRFKGWANKTPDIFAVYACYHCHTKLDSSQVSKEDQIRALMDTQIKLYQKGLLEIK